MQERNISNLPPKPEGLSLFDELPPMAPRLRQSSAKTPRSDYGGSAKASRSLREAFATTKASRRPRERSMMQSPRIVISVASKSLQGAFTSSTSSRCNRSSLTDVFKIYPSSSPRCNHVAFQFFRGATTVTSWSLHQFVKY